MLFTEESRSYPYGFSAVPSSNILDVYEDTCARLNDSLPRNVEVYGYLSVGAVNPSVNDFLRSNLSTNTVEQMKDIGSTILQKMMRRTADRTSTRYLNDQ